MPTKFVFADEAGCFTFRNTPGASKYFLLCTLAADDCSLSADLLSIRRQLSASGEEETDRLHATSDKQSTRDEVFSVLAAHNFRIDATLLEKNKAQPQTRPDEITFYKYAWYYHLKHVAPPLARRADKLLITAASIGSKKTRASFKLAVNNTLQQIVPREKWQMSFLDSAKDPMLWAADYCAWAIQRKWEKDDERSYSLIADKIHSEFDLWRSGDQRYY
jgi:hypothetical protein